MASSHPIRSQSYGKPNMTDSLQPAKQVSLSDFQLLIRRMYHEKDVARGVEGTFMWLMEEVGELATALATGRTRNVWASLPMSWPC